MARIKPRLLLLAPLILAYFRIRALPAPAWHVPADLGLLALSAAVSVGLGIWRGQTIKVWRDGDGTWWRQGSARTLALWGALIVARGLLYGLDAALGHREASGLGAILLTLALSFAARGTPSPRCGCTPCRHLPAASWLSQRPAAPWPCRPGLCSRSHPRPRAATSARAPRSARLGMKLTQRRSLG